MLRKVLYLAVTVFLLAAVLMPSSAVLADKPTPPDTVGKGPLPQGSQPEQPTVARPDASVNLPAPDMTNVPDVVKKAATLQASLSDKQQAAVRLVLDRYMPEFAQIGRNLMSRDTSLSPAQIGTRMATMLKGIDAEMANILNADQLALYRAVMAPENSFAKADLANAPKGFNSTALVQPDGAVSPQGYTSYCFYAAYYDLYSRYYGYWGYYYAYYNYYYYSTSYGYSAYYYAYYGYQYMTYAFEDSARVYFDEYYRGSYMFSEPYSSYYYNYYAQTYFYNAYYYDYYDYYYYGHSLAYYAYYYSYYGYYYAVPNTAYYCYYYS